LLVQQNPDAIDAGVFHNDVVAVANENVFLFHERAYADQANVLSNLRSAWNEVGEGKPLHLIEIPEIDLTLEDAVRSYYFNSQLVTLGPGKMAMICPDECRENENVKRVIDALIASGTSPLKEVHYFDVRESMQNGGGPACLRLRVSLTETEESDVQPGAWLTPTREAALVEWISKHYRDRLMFDDLGDPQLYLEVQTAMDALERVVGFPLA
jgi:succinylarginine dihydrolase